MIHIELIDTGERRAIEQPVWLTKNRNGIVSTRHQVKALGVSDGTENFSFGMLEGYPEAKLITRAEYEESLTEPETDPELTAEEALNIIMGGTT